MQYFEEMYEFVEGSLEPGKEMELFHALTSDPELRDKMKQLYAVKDAAKNSASKYQPNAKETLGVFSALNITPPEHLVPAAAKQGLGTKMTNMLTKYRQGITGAFLASAVILLLMNFWPDGSTETMMAEGQVNKNIPVVSSFENDNFSTNNIDFAGNRTGISNHNSRSTHTQFNNTFVARQAETTNARPVQPVIIADEDKQAGPKEFHMDASEIAELSVTPVNLNSTGFSHNGFPEYNAGFVPFNTGGNNFELIVEAQGLSSFSQENTSNSSLMNNSGITVMYPASDNWYFGIDVRKEEFYNEFSLNAGSGLDRPYSIETAPTVYSAVVRYEFDQFDFLNKINIRPLAQLTPGMTSYGDFNLRGLLGAKYNLTGNFSIMAGYELNYLNQGINYQSFSGTKGLLKNNFVYGLSYKFNL